MKILLHTCCAPCIIYPLKRLKEKGASIVGFFYNPNIYPQEEYLKRKAALESFNQDAGIEIIYPEYKPEEYTEVTKNKDGKERCLSCWTLRLKKTAKEAKEKQFEYFSTTLLVSPHQDHEALKTIGKNISDEEKIEFYYEDFRLGYREAHEEAKRRGIYCQKYCGCVHSEALSHKKHR
ncbi:MAG: epoxyqueuosine reductase QueH [Candidatus Omnitrophica bacterium]|nr:epoxyqueuosine reductase QueH [Candidatus Omnitrophota bacterium]